MTTDPAPAPGTGTGGEPIAIVGLGAVFPGAGSAAELWANVRAGVDAITDVPPHRWDPALYHDPDAFHDPPRADRFYCRRGGFVDGLATADPARFGILPAAASGIEPDQLLALRTAAEAIADAGGDERLPDRSRVGVVLGRGGYIGPGMARFDQRITAFRQVEAVLADLAPDLPADLRERIREAFRAGPDDPAVPDASAGVLPSLAASRVANRFDLRGPAYTIDGACASSLLAVEHAVRALRSRQCDAVLAGAVHHSHHVTVWSVFSRLRALSPSGTIRPLDRAADGTLLSEGTGMALLKRLPDALRSGDRIYAVIRGAGSSSDGRAAGLLSPHVDGQVLALERAWADAGLDPSAPEAAGLVEAHGTGAPAGDAAELAALRRVFGHRGAPLHIGTVKSMIGHAMPAAGMAGLIKAAYAVYDAVLPPTLHVTEPHQAMAGTRLTPVRETAGWERPAHGPRRAVVNAFGLGGVNAHLVLEEAPTTTPAHLGPLRPERAVAASRGPAHAKLQARPGDEAGERVLRLAARDAAELAETLRTPDEELLARCDREPADLPCRLAIVAPDARRLALARAVADRGTPWRGRGDIWFTPKPLLAAGGRLAFLYPGFEPSFEPRVDDVADHFGLPRPALTGRADLLGHAADVMAVGRLLATALAEAGIHPDVAAGHSLGEWTAMMVAGMNGPDSMETFVAALDPGALRIPDVSYGALGCGADRVLEALGARTDVVVSHDNCPHQSVVCGEPEAVREILRRFGAEGVLGQELPFRTGFHTPMAAPLLEQLRPAFAALPLHPPRIPLWSATTVAPFPETAEEVRELVERHLLEPVRFSELVAELHGAGVRVFVQVGPGSIAGFVGDRLGDREHLAMAVNVPQRDGMAQIRRVAAALWAEGHGAGPGAAPPLVPSGPGTVELDLGVPLVRLDGTVPPLTSPPRPAGKRTPPLPDVAGAGRTSPASATDPVTEPVTEPVTDPVAQELDAFLREAIDSANRIMDAFQGTAPPPSDAPVPPFEGPVPPVQPPPMPIPPPPPVLPVSPLVPAQPRPIRSTAHRVFSLRTMPFVADHCLISQPVDWPEMSDRFPVVPLTTLLEVMADAARELFPDLVCVGLEEVRAMRWVTADPPTGTEVSARLLEADGDGVHRVEVVIKGHTDGVVLLAPHYPRPPAPDRTPLTAETPPLISADRLYSERWMFHGPRYQGIVEISALASDGARGVLAALPTPGALMDNLGQLCGHWIQVNGDRDQTVYPTGIDRVTWYGPAPARASRVPATVRIRALTPTTMRCDAELTAPDGRVWCRVEGWETRRFHTDESTWRMKFTPEVSGVSEPQPEGWTLVRRHWSNGSSRDMLMRRYLNAAERAAYEGLTPREQDPWLLGRVAAKDAVRHWLWEHGHGPLFPAEITITDDAPGRPRAAYTTVPGTGTPPDTAPAGTSGGTFDTASGGTSGIAPAGTSGEASDRGAGDGNTFGAPLELAVAQTGDLGVALVRAAGHPCRIELVRAEASPGGRPQRRPPGTASRECDGHVVTWTLPPDDADGEPDDDPDGFDRYKGENST
ncbi:acyltransferase domain-containing protein [Actinomadura logoneensis]|uniref:Acyltransferase domain-containing protein n=1 Tax=Actinomadura logoneensis TaxID=2293572 RepID=A0A372JKF9_9ACTN|nr:type I polyketide synthase [Actinomadura logoneensis]RFU40523.1 acyltransferase domain-containing protein [Actinomadura logoneensis]